MSKQKTENRKQQNTQDRGFCSLFTVHCSLERERGFTLLLAVLVASIILSISASIFKIAQKELTLSSIGRDSQFAFYAADTGAECALYWDFRHQLFDPQPPEDAPSEPTCNGQRICDPSSLWGSCNPGLPYPQTFSFQFESDGRCARVAVEKTLIGNSPNQQVRTVVRSDGYSAACDVIDDTSLRTLQRSVELNY